MPVTKSDAFALNTDLAADLAALNPEHTYGQRVNAVSALRAHYQSRLAHIAQQLNMSDQLKARIGAALDRRGASRRRPHTRGNRPPHDRFADAQRPLN